MTPEPLLHRTDFNGCVDHFPLESLKWEGCDEIRTVPEIFPLRMGHVPDVFLEFYYTESSLGSSIDYHLESNQTLATIYTSN